jgi:hypothetical protein
MSSSTSQRTKSGASLSIVVLSVGSSADLEHAIEVMTPSIRRYGAQLIVAREDDGAAEPSLLREHPMASLVRAPKGATRAQLCDVGMAAATGDIVALRDDCAVRDVRWIESLAGAVRPVDSAVEVTVADYSDFSMVGDKQDALAPSIEAAKRHSTLSAILSTSESAARLSVPLADRRADPKRTVARET